MNEPGDATAATRERQLADVFVTLADTLVGDFDIADLLEHLVRVCVDVLGSAAAGLMLVDARGELQVLSASTEQMRVLELLELQYRDGPCLECFRTGATVHSLLSDTAADLRWPQFSPQARAAGFTLVQALPMRLRDQTIGALNLFGIGEQAVSEHGTQLAQALADVATIGLLQQRAVRDSELLSEQLQLALNERVVIEQAKGLLAERGAVEVGDAFELLRGYCRQQRLPLAAVAREILSGTRDADDVLANRWPSGPTRA